MDGMRKRSDETKERFTGGKGINEVRSVGRGGDAFDWRNEMERRGKRGNG